MKWILCVVLLSMFSCGPIEIEKTADVVMLQKDGNYYTLLLNGYNIQKWYYGQVAIKIDPSVINTTATFTQIDKKPLSRETVTLCFSSMENAQNSLNNGIGTEIDIDGNNNIAIQNENNNCFISTISN